MCESWNQLIPDCPAKLNKMPKAIVHVVVGDLPKELFTFKLPKTFEDVEAALVKQYGKLATIEIFDSEECLVAPGEELIDGEEYKCFCTHALQKVSHTPVVDGITSFRPASPSSHIGELIYSI